MSRADYAGEAGNRMSKRALLRGVLGLGAGIGLESFTALWEGRGAWAQTSGRTEAVVLTQSLGGENWLMPFTGLPEIGLLQPMFETLLYRDNDTGLVVEGQGRLAQTWSMSPDGMTYTFHLRRGVSFHDGWGDFTADDVLFSYGLATRADAKQPAASYFRSQVAQVTAPDPYTVIFAMSRPSPGLRYRLSEIAMNFGITSKRYAESVGEERASQHPIGTGPFKFSEARRGERISFVRGGPHWRVNPSLERITLRAVPDDGVRLRMLLSGEGDLCVIGFDDIAPVRQAGRQVLSAKNLVGCTIHLQGQYLEPRYPASQTPPWAQRDASRALAVRRALSLTIDRSAIVEHVLGGNGAAEGAVVGGFFPSNPGFDHTARVDPYDPDRARALLARAGYPDPSAIQFTVDLAPVPSRAWSGSITEAAAQQWAEFGFGVTTQRSDFAALQNRIIGRQATEAWCYPTPLFDDGAELLAFYTRSTDRLSWTGESVELDALMAAALNAVGPEAVVQTRQRLFAYLYENVPALCVCYADYLYGATQSFRWQMPKGVVLSNLEYASFG